MILPKSDLINSTLNSVNYKELEDDYISFLRFTDKQLQVYSTNAMFKAMSQCSSGVCISFDTTGHEVSLECKTESLIRALKILYESQGEQPEDNSSKANTIKAVGQYAKYMLEAGVKPDIRQYFDLYIDGNYIKSQRVKTGKIVFNFTNEENKWVNVKIWLPLFTQVAIRNLSCNGRHRLITKPVNRIYSFGDSITQGFMVSKPSFGYVQSLSLLMEANALNQGISGYIYNPEILNDFENLSKPQLITVAYGTNDWGLDSTFEEIEKKVKEFFARLHELYGTVPVFVITPIWRKDLSKKQKSGYLTDIIDLIKKIVKQYNNIYVIDGMEISPHCPKLFEDGFLHPGIVGNAYMIPRIYKEIIKSGICL